jgi:hypothetical protein
MKKLVKLFLVSGSLFWLGSCNNDDGPEINPEVPNEVKSGLITEDETWTNDQIWELSGKVIVTNGATLTIEKGTIIKGRLGTGSLASALIIARGAKIMAEGTAVQPVIFTSIEDDIKIGETAGTNLSKQSNELWGGVIILGKAPVSAEKGDNEAQIEGIPAEESFGLYGGTIADDNSGVFKYVSIRHGGVSIGAGNEINALTLGGVGTATTVDHVEVFATLDDGVEVFGGTVNPTNILVYWMGDDGIDIDQNYSGTIDNFMVIHGSGVGTDEGLEIDGPEGTLDDGFFTLRNGTLISDNAEGSAADFKSKAQGTIQNVVWRDYAGGAAIKIRASYDADCTTGKEDAFVYLTNASPKLVFNNVSFGSVNVYTSSADASGNTCAVPASDQTAAEGKISNSTSATGADISEFEGWTLTSVVSDII